MAKECVYPNGVLTVLIRDDSPMIHCNDSPAYRSVRIDLTPEQVQKLALHVTYSHGPDRFYEQISKCFIEPGTFRYSEQAVESPAG